MRSEWKRVPLGDLVGYISKGIAPTYADKESETTVRVLNQKCNRNFRISYSEARLHDLAQKKVGSERYVRSGDILINSTGVGTSGRIAQIDSVPCDTIVDGHMIIVRTNGAVTQKYLGYALKVHQQEVLQLDEGSTGQTELNRERLLDEILVSYPVERETQEKIVFCLEGIEKKIFTNEQINDNLQQQARAIFHEWFIAPLQTDGSDETEFGMLPYGFSTKKVGELPIIVTDYVANGSFASLKTNVKLYQEPNYAYFIRNTDLKSDTFEVYVDEHSYNFLSKSRLFGGEIIISNVGDVGSVFLCPILDAPMTLGNNIIMLKPECDELRYYLYIWFKWSFGQGLIQGIKGGSAQPKFNKTDFRALPVILPPRELLRKFNLTVNPMFKAIEGNRSQNRNLASLRDALLPKLMAGELDVSDVKL